MLSSAASKLYSYFSGLGYYFSVGFFGCDNLIRQPDSRGVVPQ